ncbi:MAG TPA: nitrite/sulfite reductase [Mycobacteriales bacterium]|jgi:sulfite reductase (ferredoxin)|nr:nitrite/sulfite reductase [Mycobacteriales bacterium]
MSEQPARPRPSRRTAGQGQWALGHLEPLNPNERTKKDDDGLNVRQRIETIYSKLGFASIDGADLRGRFRWWGLYTQRRPGIDGGKTAILEPEELDDEFFMLRVRIPGGRLSNTQLRTIATIATEFGRDVADVTDRQNIQLHWIRIEDVPEIWERLEGVGLSTAEACGDTPRNMLGCPLAGVDADEVLDGTEALLATNRLAEGNKEFSNLPRKYKTAVSGCPVQCVGHEINDISFVGVRADDAKNGSQRVGFDLWVGGGLSTNPIFAKRLGVFVEPDAVPEVWAGVTKVFRDYGYRKSRNRARLKFLVADWGPEKFREVLEKDYLGHALEDGPAPLPPSGPRDHVGVRKQKDGRNYVGFALQSGRTSGMQLTEIAELAAQHGSGDVAMSVEQKIIVRDVPDAQVEALVAELERRDLRVQPSVFRRGTMACTGIEFCKLAIVETKVRSVELYEELERRLPDFDTPLTINLNGCPNSCARFQTADIGLKGSIVEDGEGFQVHLGGSIGGDDSGFGRKLRGLKVTSAELPDYIERVLRNYTTDRGDGESFATWVRRADESLIL